ncbi:MAG TPA: biotin/lipoyl-containing protein, partial [Candidatus Limnocylindria bacterium]|nr:biotin/lipoyl-containing protein [Candidatus Limnocylindria bacterium]
ENASFAAAVRDAGLTWVGPPPGAIAAMGDKAAARRRVAAHGVPIVPGYDGADQDDERLASEADRVGYPLLVKPAAGGGGKGMRLVHGREALSDALAAARREARGAFGDERLILERYVHGARHVEVQVLFDEHGAGAHLGERDCSVQRRRQKVLEEAPAPWVEPGLRRRMGDAALAAAGSVGYEGAGTVEFLLADDGSFHFLEMNTRLQVEHPVTEAVTGRDLVADQLRIAAGASLAEIGLPGSVERFDGHAVEARLYAEDPDAGFLPAAGRVVALRWPEADASLRIDTALRPGDVVDDRFDPMLAKLIAHGRDRDEALARLRAALDGTLLLGVRSNLRFLRWLLRQPWLAAGEARTDTLDSAPMQAAAIPRDDHWRAAASLLAARDASPWSGGWRLNGRAALRVAVGDDERRIEVPAGRAGAADREPAAAREGDLVHVDVDGQSVEFRLASAPSVEEAMRHAAAHGGGTARLTAPMPGRVIAVRAAEGDAVEAHQPVAIIEAMKMEHAVVAPVAGRVTLVAVRAGEQVARGALLAEVAPAEA